jgi:hypothetical protein
MTQVQRHQRCVWRAVWLMALLAGLSALGVAYAAVLLETFPFGKAVIILKLICAPGLAALISMVAFVVLLMIYRRDLNCLREQCRCLATRLLESRLGSPRTLALAEAVKPAELIAGEKKRFEPAKSSELDAELLVTAIEQGQNSNQSPRLTS